MNKAVITCNPTDTLQEVQKLMMKHRISRVVATDAEKKPVGITTQKDIVDFLLADTSRRGVEEIPVKEVMSRNLITVKPATSLPDVAKTMIKKKISSLVVVGDDGNLKGIATKADIGMYLGSKGAGIYSVHEFMTPNPVTVRPSQSIFLAVSLMSEHNISRTVVVDKESKPIGIITLADAIMIGSLLKVRPPYTSPKIIRGGMRLLVARDFMTANPLLINKDADLADAARLMTRHAISGLPVVDKAGKLVGIITKSDLTRAVASLKD